MYTDQQYETIADLAREREAGIAAPALCYEHGLKIGRIIEVALHVAEIELCGVRRADALYLAECTREAFWGELEAELGGAPIDFRDVDTGIRQASPRYAEALETSKRETV